MKDHFWKIFSAVAFFGVFYLAYHITWEKDFLRVAKIEVNNKRDSVYPDALLGASNRQAGSATVILKERAAAVTGFISNETDGDYLILNTLFSTDGKEELTAIPWGNVLYVKMHLMPLPKK